MTSDPAQPPTPPSSPLPPHRPAPGSWIRTQLTAGVQRTASGLRRRPSAALPACPGPPVSRPAPLSPPAQVPASAPAPESRRPAHHNPYPLPEPDHLHRPDFLSRPDYTVVLAISPQMRARHPEWPLSLEEALNAGQPPPDPNPDHRGRASWTELPGTPQAPVRARAKVGDTLAQWGLTDLSAEAGQLAAELVAGAVGQAAGSPVGLTISEHRPPGQRPWIQCAVTGTPPDPPPAQTAEPRSESRVRATTTGRDSTSHGTTTWFTLISRHPQASTRADPQRDRELEAGG